jgi:hypothetical protein
MYTEKEHAENLLKLLSKKRPCVHCVHGFQLEAKLREVCDMCWSFIGRVRPLYSCPCPCIVLGKAEALKQTWLALEEKGYTE